jgi:hypothetical protein
LYGHSWASQLASAVNKTIKKPQEDWGLHNAQFKAVAVMLQGKARMQLINADTIELWHPGRQLLRPKSADCKQ